MVPGVVQNIFDYSLCIDLPNTIVASAPHKHINCNTPLDTIQKKYRVGQTVFARILQETKKWLGLKCRCLIEKHVDDWFIDRLENGLPASLPYDAQHSIGDSVEGCIIDSHLPAQQFVLTLDLKKPIRFTFDPSSTSITQCTILCQLPAYALAIHPATHHLIHLPTFSDLNSFYSNSSSSGTYQRHQEVQLTAVTPIVSEQHRYIIVVPSSKTQSSVRVYQPNDSVPVSIISQIWLEGSRSELEMNWTLCR